MRNFILLFVLLGTTAGYAQEITGKEAQKAVSRLHFITGNWAGSGWMTGPDGQKHYFTQTEHIRFKLDSTAILIEGLGKDGQKVIHNAMAVVTFNQPENNYNFHSYLANGRSGRFKAELLDGKFYWYPNENMRYIIYLNEKGQWYETGEIRRDHNWSQFFEMTLDKL